MTNLNLPLIPTSRMFIGDIMSREWQEFFRLLLDRVGGIESESLSDIAVALSAGLYDVNRDPEVETQVPDVVGSIQGLIDRIESLEEQMESTATTFDGLPADPLNLEPINPTTPAGSSGEVQFNDSGSLGADSDLFWSKSSGKLGVGTNTPSHTLEVVGNTKLGDGGANYAGFQGDGELLLFGTARARKFVQIPAGSAKAPGVKPATFTSLGLNGAWQFSGVLDNNVSMAFAIPLEFDITGPVSFRIGWSSPDTTGNVLWQLQYLWLSLDDDSSSTVPDATVQTVVSVSTVAYGYNIVSFSMVSPSPGDRICQIKLSRLGNDVQDTSTQVSFFIGAVIEYTMNKLGT